MMDAVARIKQKHEDLRGALESGDNVVEAARSLLDEISNAAVEVPDLPSRSQLRSMLRFWQEDIYEQTGIFIMANLAPAL